MGLGRLVSSNWCARVRVDPEQVKDEGWHALKTNIFLFDEVSLLRSFRDIKHTVNACFVAQGMVSPNKPEIKTVNALAICFCLCELCACRRSRRTRRCTCRALEAAWAHPSSTSIRS